MVVLIILLFASMAADAFLILMGVLSLEWIYFVGSVAVTFFCNFLYKFFKDLADEWEEKEEKS